MREILKTKENIVICVLAIAIFLVVTMLISNIVKTRTSLDKIIYDTKVEAEEELISNGTVTYTKDVENDIEARPLSDENLPKNTTDNQQEIGTIVAPKANWNIETVTAVSVGNGDTVPVPKGLYYVGGDLSTGVIISDDKVDEYDGQTDKTTWEYTTNLKGNQFVWIPCTEEEYTKCEVWNGTTQKPTGTTSKDGTLCSTGWDKTTYTSELPQIRKYGGFYVARYEAGLAKTISEFTSNQQNTGKNQVYNKEGIPQSRAGVVPWNFIDWETSRKNAKNMYNTSSVSSGLITGAQWDVMLKKMVEKTDLTEADLIDSKNWGNYKNNSIEYKGRMASFSNVLSAFRGETEGKTTLNANNLLTTGASKQTEKYHIFDVAGNLAERTEEASLWKAESANETNTQIKVMRGGAFNFASSDLPACYRQGQDTMDYFYMGAGFRVVLYLK